VQLSGNISASAYFDYERYGRDIALRDGYFLTEEIFLFYGDEPDSQLYTRDELLERLNDGRLMPLGEA
jgi:hypothetical protein